jgi:hypothetical protein
MMVALTKDMEKEVVKMPNMQEIFWYEINKSYQKFSG